MSQNNQNNFGFLRLLFASLVIVSHSPELVDGNRSREILTKIFGTISFGELAVDCFFLISGYLIIKSFYASSNLKSYLLKRILRIYPGFIVASIICVLFVAPFLSGWQLIQQLNFKDWLVIAFKMSILDTPYIEGQKTFTLNGSMWTVWLEFICYLCVPAFFSLRLHNKKPYLIVLLCLITIYLYNQFTHKDIVFWYPIRFSISDFARLYSAFLIGGAFYLFKDKVVWSKKYTIISLSSLSVLLFNKNFAEVGLFLFGAYLLFNFALNYRNKFLNNVGTKVDISYGIYLYAYPVQVIIVRYYPQINIYLLTLCTLIIAASMGYLSWILVEKPFIKIKSLLV